MTLRCGQIAIFVNNGGVHEVWVFDPESFFGIEVEFLGKLEDVPQDVTFSREKVRKFICDEAARYGLIATMDSDSFIFNFD